jgi:hypothetical protein
MFILQILPAPIGQPGGIGNSIQFDNPNKRRPESQFLVPDWGMPALASECRSKREGMGLLEYQTVPSLRDVAHDRWLCKFSNLLYSSWKFHQLAAGQQFLSGQPGWYGKGRLTGVYSPSITYKITPAESLSFSQQDGLPCWASPLAFFLIGCSSGLYSLAAR